MEGIIFIGQFGSDLHVPDAELFSRGINHCQTTCIRGRQGNPSTGAGQLEGQRQGFVVFLMDNPHFREDET
ncbi:MAG: hypothetical protein U0O39_07520, partial [Akkermansia sp.]